MTIWRMRIACWIPKATRHTLRIRNTYCFSTAKMVRRTSRNVRLYEQWLSCSIGRTFQGIFKNVLLQKTSFHIKLLFSQSKVHCPIISCSWTTATHWNVQRMCDRHLALLIRDSDNAASWNIDGSCCHSRQANEDFVLPRNARPDLLWGPPNFLFSAHLQPPLRW
jgi:hypothetical protein